jgi:hypothetical protein
VDHLIVAAVAPPPAVGLGRLRLVLPAVPFGPVVDAPTAASRRGHGGRLPRRELDVPCPLRLAYARSSIALSAIDQGGQRERNQGHGQKPRRVRRDPQPALFEDPLHTHRRGCEETPARGPGFGEAQRRETQNRSRAAEHPHRMDPPNVFAILTNSAIGRELAHSGRANDRLPRPPLGILVGGRYRHLAVHV